MPILLGIFTGLTTFVSSLFAQIVLIMGRKYATGALSVITYILVTFAFFACIKTILLIVSAAIIMPPGILMFFSWFIPSNFISVISSIVSARICHRAYQMTVRKLILFNDAS